MHVIKCKVADKASKFNCLICVDLRKHGLGCEDCPDCNINLAAADDATW